MSTPNDAWKRRALEDFRKWLDDLPEGAAGVEDDIPDSEISPGCDLRGLFAEFAALRQEIHLRNREQARAVRELAKAAAVFDTAGSRAQRHEEDLAGFERRIARAAENRCLSAVLEVRDALERGREAAVRLRDPPRLVPAPAPGGRRGRGRLRADDQTLRPDAVPVQRAALAGGG